MELVGIQSRHRHVTEQLESNKPEGCLQEANSKPEQDEKRVIISQKKQWQREFSLLYFCMRMVVGMVVVCVLTGMCVHMCEGMKARSYVI